MPSKSKSKAKPKSNSTSNPNSNSNSNSTSTPNCKVVDLPSQSASSAVESGTRTGRPYLFNPSSSATSEVVDAIPSPSSLLAVTSGTRSGWQSLPSSPSPMGDAGLATSVGPAASLPGPSAVFVEIANIRRRQDSAEAAARSLESSLSSFDRRIFRLQLGMSDLHDPEVGHPWSSEVDSLRNDVDSLKEEAKALRDSTDRLWDIFSAFQSVWGPRMGGSSAPSPPAGASAVAAVPAPVPPAGAPDDAAVQAPVPPAGAPDVAANSSSSTTSTTLPNPTSSLITAPTVLPHPNLARKARRRRRGKRSKLSSFPNPTILQPPLYYYSSDFLAYCPMGPGHHSFAWVEALRCWSSPRLYSFPPLLEVPPTSYSPPKPPQLTVPRFAPVR